MRLLVVSQYLWPEDFRINELVLELGKRGHEITVLTGYPNYPGGKFFPEFIDVPPVVVPLPMLDLPRSVVPGARASGGTKAMV